MIGDYHVTIADQGKLGGRKRLVRCLEYPPALIHRCVEIAVFRECRSKKSHTQFHRLFCSRSRTDNDSYQFYRDFRPVRVSTHVILPLFHPVRCNIWPSLRPEVPVLLGSLVRL